MPCTSASVWLSVCISLSVPLRGSGPATDRSEKLNAPLDYELVVGDVAGFQVAPGGDWVVYRAQQETTRYELFALRSDRTVGPMRVSAPGHEVVDFELHGPRVVYRTARELYKVGLDLVPVRLNAPLTGGQKVVDFETAGLRVLFLLEHESGGPRQLYSVPIDGGTAVPLSPTPSGFYGEYVLGFDVTPDRTQVVMLANLTGTEELFRVPIDGSSAPVPLCGSFVSGGNVRSDLVQMSPDGQRMVYVADQLNDTRFELFSVPVDGSALPIRLNSQLPTGGDVDGFAIDPASSRVVYRSDQTVNDRLDLHVVPIDGSAPFVPLATGVSSAFFPISPAGDRVVFLGPCATAPQVFSARVDGTQPPVQLSDVPAGGCSIDAAITPDGSRVVYRARVGSVPELFSVPLGGGSSPVKLNAPLALSAQVSSYGFAPDGGMVVYRTEAVTSELFAVPADGSALAVPMNPSPRAGTRLETDFVVDGGRAFFRGDVGQHQVVELHAAPLDASAGPLVLNDTLATNARVAYVDSFALSPDGQWAVYATGVEVASVPLGAPADVRRLVGLGSGLSAFSELVVSPDSSRVLFRATTDDGWQIFVAAIDGSAPPVQLSGGAFAPGFGYGGIRVSPDGRWVQYGSYTYYGFGPSYLAPLDGSAGPVAFGGFDVSFSQDGAQMLHLSGGPTPYYFLPTVLQSRPTDMSAAAVQLAPYPSDAWATVAVYQPCADWTRIVYVCDQELEGTYELYSVLADGSALPVEISGSAGVERDVSFGFHETPDGTRVVYAEDRDANEAYELYVAPVDGSGAPLELNGPMVAGGDVALGPRYGSLNVGAPLVQMTADSSRLVYVADQEADETFELYAVPLDGSALPVKVSGPLVANGDVSLDVNGVRISPDGSRVVYLADREQDERFGLYSAPIDGSGPIVPLAGVLGAQSDVRPGFVILDSENAVLFLADLAVNEQLELWYAPLDGSRPPTRRSALANPAGSLQSDFVLSPDGRDVLYRADAERDGVVELFRFPIRRVPQHVTR